MMKTTERFDKAYKALYNAFMNGTLAKWDCAACACGNIIAAANNLILTSEELKSRSDCSISISEIDYNSQIGVKIEKLWKSNFSSIDLKTNDNYLFKVNSAGYTGLEFSRIEIAFETNTKIRSFDYYLFTENEILNDQYNGLIAVMDVLIELDNIENITEKESFKNHPNLILA